MTKPTRIEDPNGDVRDRVNMEISLQSDLEQMLKLMAALERDDPEDRDDFLSEKIKEDQPAVKEDNFNAYVRALELVSNRHSKGALVCLVNHLICEIERLGGSIEPAKPVKVAA